LHETIKLYHLWLGTDDGIFRYELENGDATHYGTDEGLTGNVINAICIVNENLVYAGTQAGLSVYQDGIWGKVTLELPSEDIRALMLDDRLLWLGTMSGLAKYDMEQGRAETVDIGEGFSHRSIKSICIKDDSLWLGTTAGLLQVGRDDGSLIEEYRTSLVKQPFREPSVSNIEFDGDYVWFSNWSASSNGAIVRYDRKTKTWRKFTRADILRDTRVAAPSQVKRILVTARYVWFATDYGVLRYDKSLDMWKHYTMEDGLGLNDLRYIVESNKSIWATTDDAVSVSRYDKDSEEWEVIDLPLVPNRPEMILSI